MSDTAIIGAHAPQFQRPLPTPLARAGVADAEVDDTGKTQERALLLAETESTHARQATRAVLRQLLSQLTLAQQGIERPAEAADHHPGQRLGEKGAARLDGDGTVTEQQARRSALIAEVSQTLGLSEAISDDDPGLPRLLALVRTALQLSAGEELPELSDDYEWQMSALKGRAQREMVQVTLVTDAHRALDKARSQQWPATAEGRETLSSIRATLAAELSLHPKEAKEMFGVGTVADDALDEVPLDRSAGGDFGDHYEFFERLIGALSELEGDWLGRHQDILEDYMKYFEKLTSVLAKMGDTIKESNDKGEYRVDFGPIVNELSELWSVSLGPAFENRAQAQAFLDALGNPKGLSISYGPVDGKTYLVLGYELVAELMSTMSEPPDGTAGVSGWISSAKYNAIIAGKDSVLESFNKLSKILTDKYQRTMQQWDTLVKALSATIDSITDADKVFANNLT